MVGGLSSAGRAPALQAGGHRFDPDRLHQFRMDRHTPEMKTTDPARSNPGSGNCGICPLFDIVNGFLIDAVAHGVRSFKGLDA